MDIATQITNMSQRDRRAAVRVIQKHNVQRASAVPPLAALPFASGAEIKTSYESIMAEKLQRVHASHVVQDAEAQRPTVVAWEAATDAQRDASVAALTA